MHLAVLKADVQQRSSFIVSKELGWSIKLSGHS
jgi:hypothetical protein